MLILTRKLDETIKIGDDITIRIVGINRSQVKIGIDAPKNIAVHREEIYNIVQQQKTNPKPQSP